MTRPGLTWAAHSSGAPLPPPMRTSRGFLVTGRSGKTRIHSLPARLTCLWIAMRAASIWREVSRAGSVAWRPKSPKDTSLPAVAMPRLLPFCILRYLVRFGESIAGAPLLDPPRLALQDLALEHPDLDADDADLGLGLGQAELD